MAKLGLRLEPETSQTTQQRRSIINILSHVLMPEAVTIRWRNYGVFSDQSLGVGLSRYLKIKNKYTKRNSTDHIYYNLTHSVRKLTLIIAPIVQST